jgi:hypothetical protein
VESIEQMDRDKRYRVDGYGGVAWSYIGPETQATEDTYWDGIEEPTGNVLMVMVGDDRTFAFDPFDVFELDELAYCASCGQIGCTADGRDRDDDESED